RSDCLRKDQHRVPPLWVARLFENFRSASGSTFGERNPAYRAKRCDYTESTSRPSRCSSRHAELLVSATMLLSTSPALPVCPGNNLDPPSRTRGSPRPGSPPLRAESLAEAPRAATPRQCANGVPL